MDWKVVSGFLFFYCVYTLTRVVGKGKSRMAGRLRESNKKKEEKV